MILLPKPEPIWKPPALLLVMSWLNAPLTCGCLGRFTRSTLVLPDGRIDDAAMPGVRAAFAAAYAARYTSVYDGVAVQLVSLRVRCRGKLPELAIEQVETGAGGSEQKAVRSAFFGDG